MRVYQNIMQWKFTACQYNMENANGFNTFSMSEGLSREDKEDLIAGSGSYTPPDHLPYHPTQEEIATLFPIVFSSFPLRSGKWAVTRTVYIGKDYAGVRWGNFFSHALVFPEGFHPFYPIQLWNSPLFANGLTPEEMQIQTTPPPLPCLTIQDEDLMDFSTKIPLFLADETDRPSTLISLVNAVRNRSTTNKNVILCDLRDNIPFWIAAVQYAFPLRLACGISFTTYLHSTANMQRFHFAATSTEGHTIPLKSPSLAATSYVFNLAEDCVPSVSLSSRIYTEMIQCDEPSYPGYDLQEMQKFMDEIECKISDQSLDKAVLLYKYLNWNVIPKSMEVFQTILSFYASQPLDNKKRLTLQIFRKNDLLEPEILAFLFPHFIEVILASGKSPEMVRPFLAFFVRQFERNPSERNTEDAKKRFQILDAFFEKYYPALGEEILACLHEKYIKSNEAKKYAFLYASLLLSQFVVKEVEFREYFTFLDMIPFSKNEFENFMDEILEIAISKAVRPVVYERIIHLLKRNESDDENRHAFISKYHFISKLAKYSMSQWQFGNFSQKQGIAFIKYLLTINEDEWSAWAFSENIQQLFLPLGYGNQKIKKITYTTILSQLSLEQYPKLSEDENNRLKNRLIFYKTPWERFCGLVESLVERIWKARKPILFFLVGLTLVIVLILLLINLCCS